MTTTDASMNTYYSSYSTSPAVSRKKIAGAMLAGGLLGMNAYYFPVNKDIFVQKSFDLTKAEADNQIAVLTGIAKEVDNKSVSTQSKMILQEMGLGQDVVEITKKCIDLDKSVTDPAAVKKLKAGFDSNFASYKKQPSLMDNTCAEAFRTIKRNKFKWGTGIGAAIGLALGLILSKN